MKRIFILAFLLISFVIFSDEITLEQYNKLKKQILECGVSIVMEVEDTENIKVDNKTMERLIEILNRRISEFGLAELGIQRSGDRRVIIELAVVDNQEEIVSLLGKTALLEFRLKKENGEFGEVLLSVQNLESAFATFDSIGIPQIAFKLNFEETKVFAEITKKNIGKQLAIMLDGIQQTAPTIQSKISSGRCVITGNYTVDEAKNIAALLNAGTLPVQVKILEIRSRNYHGIDKTSLKENLNLDAIEEYINKTFEENINIKEGELIISPLIWDELTKKSNDQLLLIFSAVRLVKYGKTNFKIINKLNENQILCEIDEEKISKNKFLDILDRNPIQNFLR